MVRPEKINYRFLAGSQTLKCCYSVVVASALTKACKLLSRQTINK